MASATRISVRLTPRASRDEIVGLRDGVLRVRVTAPPVDGAANEALLRLLAKALRVPPRDLRIASGAASRTKVVEVAGLDSGEVAERLAPGGVSGPQ